MYLMPWEKEKSSPPGKETKEMFVEEGAFSLVLISLGTKIGVMYMRQEEFIRSSNAVSPVESGSFESINDSRTVLLMNHPRSSAQ